jgi:hypothetical protein
MADVEVLQAALSLRAPVPVGGHLDVAEAVEFPPHPGGVQSDGDVQDLRFVSVVVGHERSLPFGAYAVMLTLIGPPLPPGNPLGWSLAFAGVWLKPPGKH